MFGTRSIAILGLIAAFKAIATTIAATATRATTAAHRITFDRIAIGIEAFGFSRINFAITIIGAAGNVAADFCNDMQSII
jgi:hypothetical protein